MKKLLGKSTARKSPLPLNNMKSKLKCYETKNGQFDTGGNPIKVRICYCGTTACLKLGNNDYPLPKRIKEISEMHPIDRPCKECGVPNLYQSKKCSIHSR